jgi:hypothetical protein
MMEQVVVTTLEATPDDGSTQWSTPSLAAKVELNQTAVSRIWRTFGSKPHRIEDFKLSTDPHFIEKVRDVVGLYLSPPDAAVMSCVDEKTQMQALDLTRAGVADPAGHRGPPRLHLRPQRHFRPVRATRCGVGPVITQMTDQYPAVEFRAFLNLIARTVPDGLAVRVACDNACTHKAPEIQRWLKSDRR